jgi:hypothetical protein
MMQDVHVTLNPVYYSKSSIQPEEDSFHEQVRPKFKERNF